MRGSSDQKGWQWSFLNFFDHLSGGARIARPGAELEGAVLLLIDFIDRLGRRILQFEFGCGLLD